MKASHLLFAGLVVFAGLAGPAHAADLTPQPTVDPVFKHWMVRVGVAHVGWDDSAKVSVGGARVPGGSAKLSNNWGIEGDVNYFFNPNVSLTLALGVPPTTTLRGDGTLSAAGKLGKVTYGPAVFAARYHLTGLGPFVPYVGAGVNYTLIFGTKDNLLRNLKVDDTVGPVLVGGFDLALDDSWGIYFDVKKVWTKADAKFRLPVGPGVTAPGKAKVTLNPLILNTGISYRF